MQRRKTRTKRRNAGAALLAALGLAGCGGGSEHRAAAQPPKLPPALGSNLAARSDRVAQALEAGDACGAAAFAKDLQQQTIAAINAHRVPAPFQEDLAASVTDLVSRIECIPVQQPRGPGKHKGKDKKKHKGKGHD